MSYRPVLVPTLALIAGVMSAGEAPPTVTDTLVVVGSTQAEAVRLPGTATVLDNRQLKTHRYDSVHDILRQVPSSGVVDEDGHGLRANVGFRGVSPIRSAKVHMMEDGVPLASNPYNDAGLYVSPAYGRFTAVEVIKGSGQILYGPHTVAGVVNFKTTPLTYAQRAAVDFAGGSHDTIRGRAMIEVPLHQDLTVAVDAYLRNSAGFRPHDDVSHNELVGRLGWRPVSDHRVELKLYHGEEDSNMTYQGLSRADFNRNPYHRYNFTADDVIEARRRGATLRHRWDYDADGNFVTTAYVQDVDRRWNRAYFAFDAANETYVGTLTGGTYDRVDRDRCYYMLGLETRWHHRFDAGLPLVVDAGARVHGEGQINREIDRVATTNALLERNRIDRDTIAIAGWFQVDAHVTSGFHIIPGVRVEHVAITSHRKVNNFAPTTDPEGSSELVEVMPGLGFTAELGAGTQLYGGVHRGFSPPSYSQAILASGVDANLDAETSWNYELGLRLDYGPGLYADLTVFYIDWENLVTTPLAGQPGVNAGQSTHYGAEAMIESDLARGAGLTYGLPLRLAAGYVVARYDQDAYSNGVLVAQAGNDREYAPRLTLSATAGIEGIGPREAMHAYLVASYRGKQYTDGLNTVHVTPQGDRGQLEAVTILDLTVKWKPADAGYELYVTGQNILDTEYAAFRRSGQGTMSGVPLTTLVGVAASF